MIIFIFSNPLTVSLFTDNLCFNTLFWANFKHFFAFKPNVGDTFGTTITHIDAESTLVYVSVPNPNIDYVDDMIVELNEYFNDPAKTKEEIETKKFNDSFDPNRDLNGTVFCAQYHVDSMWYRVKVLRRNSDGSKVTRNNSLS